MCHIHVDEDGTPFTTTSISEFNDHCTTTEGHRDEGKTFAAVAVSSFTFSIPFKPLGNDGSKGVADMHIMCNDCDPEQDKEIKIVKAKPQARSKKK